MCLSQTALLSSKAHRLPESGDTLVEMTIWQTMLQRVSSSDGSRVGYGAVAFLPFVNACGRIHCSFVMGKARLAPIREITIPRLALTAVVISVKLCQIIREELETKIDQVNYWTDSMTVLKCINNDTKRFHVFESNRLTIIQSTSSP